MQKITPFLWFDSNAEEAVNYYLSIFKNSKILEVVKYPKSAEEVSGKKAGTIMTIHFSIEGQEFTAINGGPDFKFNEAISFVVNCKDQIEIDYYWDKLSQGGDEKAQICGWLKDKYGVSWQIVPKIIGKLIKSEKAMQNLLKMKKIDIKKLNEV
ncbi:MAG: VOC family protein [Candidatus Gracilibacteria bacterium]|nr:VOC family protein [Candidatus Gracilibacteria bacterium]